MADVNFNQRYGPGQAANGQFVPIDMSTLSPSYTGDGRFAVLTYNVGTDTASITGSSVIAIPNTTYYATTAIAATAVTTVTFPASVSNVEVYNNDPSTKVYLSFNTGSLATLSAEGLPIQGDSFYSTDMECSTLYIANVATTTPDVRVIGRTRS